MSAQEIWLGIALLGFITGFFGGIVFEYYRWKKCFAIWAKVKK